MNPFSLDKTGRMIPGLAALVGWLLTVPLAANAQEIIPLYPAAVPNSKPTDVQETGAESGLYKGVTKPTLEYFKPAADNVSGAAVIVVAGCGYGLVVYRGEGISMAKALAEKGVADGHVLVFIMPTSGGVIKESNNF